MGVPTVRVSVARVNRTPTVVLPYSAPAMYAFRFVVAHSIVVMVRRVTPVVIVWLVPVALAISALPKPLVALASRARWTPAMSITTVSCRQRVHRIGKAMHLGRRVPTTRNVVMVRAGWVIASILFRVNDCDCGAGQVCTSIPRVGSWWRVVLVAS